MGRNKGTSKTGGRKRGTPNKVTIETREWLIKLIDKNRSQIEEDLKAIDPRSRLVILEKLMQYTLPKFSNIQSTVNFSEMTNAQLDEIISKIAKNNENYN